MIRVALDTVLTSARVLQDLRPPEEQAALNEIERLHERGLIKRVTTEISRIEERRISTVERREKVQAGWSEVSVVQSSPVLLGFSNLDYGARGFIANPIMSDIRRKRRKGTGKNRARYQRRTRNSICRWREREMRLLRHPRSQRLEPTQSCNRDVVTTTQNRETHGVHSRVERTAATTRQLTISNASQESATDCMSSSFR